MNSVTSTAAISLQQSRNAKNIALLATVISGLTASFYDYLAFQSGTRNIYFLSVDVWLLTAFLLTSYIIIRRGRHRTGIWMILISADISFAVAPFILSGLGLILGISLVILITLVAGQTLTGREAERAILLGAVFAAAEILIDLFGPATRTPAPQALQFGLSAFMIAAALVFGITFLRQFQQYKIAARFSALMMMITLPFVAAVAIAVTTSAGNTIEQQANESLTAHDQLVRTNLNTWLDLNNRALVELATLPDITSLDPSQQKPVLVSMAKAYPNLFLVQTTNLNGINVARSDSSPLTDYHDRNWFLGAKAGAPFTLEALISRTNGKPALNMSTPIKDASGNIVGVASIVSTLDEITKTVDARPADANSLVFIVDAKNNIIAHPDPTFTSGSSLHNYSNYPPVAAMRSGTTGIIDFTDENGTQWRASIDQLDNGWGVISQEPLDSLLAPLHLFQRISAVIGMIGLAILFGIAWFAIHFTLRPVEGLTETAEAIAAGDLSRTVTVTSQDELGVLGNAFNHMTSQVRGLIGNLEQRVSERTAELERRAVLLRTAATVANAAASIQDLSTLLNQTVRLLSQRFGFYHAGVFLLDETGKFALLRAASSEGGQQMLRRGHKLEVGRVGIVGYVAEKAEARIALDVGADAVFFDNPDLPETRSEMALPIRAAGRVIGVLDIQSTEPLAFTDSDIETLQIVADQLAISIENSNLLTESRAAIEATRRAYGQIASEAWKQLLEQQQTLGFISNERETRPLILSKEAAVPEALDAMLQKRSILSADEVRLFTPIVVRGQPIGVLRLVKPQQERWTENESQIIQSLADQLSGALESARLYDQAQRQAAKEQIISNITSKISSSINMRNVLQTAAEELGHAIPGSEVVIQFQDNREIEQSEK